jgi:hypothetical protein
MALMVKIMLSLPEKVIRHTSGICFYKVKNQFQMQSSLRDACSRSSPADNPHLRNTLFALASVCDTLREPREDGDFRNPLKMAA